MQDEATRLKWVQMEDELFDMFKDKDAEVITQAGLIEYIKEFSKRRVEAGLNIPNISDAVIGDLFTILN